MTHQYLVILMSMKKYAVDLQLHMTVKMLATYLRNQIQNLKRTEIDLCKGVS